MELRRRLIWVAVCVAAALALVSAGDARGFRRYVRLRDDLAQLSAKNHQLSDQNSRLGREIDALRKDPQALERASREELGFVKPGEIVINVE
jgi:cell division protein FtsB